LGFSNLSEQPRLVQIVDQNDRASDRFAFMCPLVFAYEAAEGIVRSFGPVIVTFASPRLIEVSDQRGRKGDAEPNDTFD